MADNDREHVSFGKRKHRKKSKLRVMKHNFKKLLRRRFWLVPATVVTVLMLALCGFWMLKSVQDADRQGLRAEAQRNVGSGYHDIVYKGKGYRYNDRITTILYAGLDSVGDIVTNQYYNSTAPQSDSVNLIVIDELNHKITIIALNRNTMTKIRKYTLKGRDRGQFTDQLCLAYAYGDGAKASCENLAEAVSELLYGIPVNEYVVSNRSSIQKMGEAVGDVTVTVPNEDLAALGYHTGDKAIINGENIETFVRKRDIRVDFSNNGRMERQIAYMDGAINQIKRQIVEDPVAMWNKMESMEKAVYTNITRNRYLDLVNSLKNAEYVEGSFYSPVGETIKATLFNEFYTDEDALLAKVIELFYIEK